MKIIDNLYSTLWEYWKRGGGLIAISSLLAKLSGFVLSIIVVRFISKDIYGDISYAKSILALFLPFIGFGVMHSLLRFGSLSTEKNSLFFYSIKRAFSTTIFLIIVLQILAPFLTQKIPSSLLYFRILIFSLLSLSLLGTYQSYLRIKKENFKYAQTNLFYTIFILFFSILALWLSGPKWFVAVSVFVPIFIFLFYFIKYTSKLNISKLSDNFNRKEFYKYGLFVGLGSIVSTLLTTSDIIMVGSITGDSSLVAIYRVGVMVPIQLLFIPSSFMLSDFVYIAEKHYDKQFLRKKFYNYLKIFSLIGFVLTCILFFSSDWLVKTIYSEAYSSSSKIMKILSFSMLISFVIKIPIGNIFNAIGKAKINVIIVSFTLVLNLILNFYFINLMGIEGAAIATLISNIFSSLLSVVWFLLETKDNSIKCQKKY